MISQLLYVILACDFNGLIASCPMVIGKQLMQRIFKIAALNQTILLGGHHVQVSAMINHCHTPIDISFLVMGSNDRMPEAHNTEQVS